MIKLEWEIRDHLAALRKRRGDSKHGQAHAELIGEIAALEWVLGEVEYP